MRRSLCKAGFCLAGFCTALSIAAEISTRPTAADKLAGEALLRSARDLITASADTPARAGRLVAIVRFAERLNPGSAEPYQMLADIYRAQGDNLRAGDALEKYLTANRDDYARSIRWLDLKLANLDDADQRIAFLTSVIRDERYPPEIRSEASGLHGGILHRQGRIESARNAFNKALEYDEWNSLAHTGLLALEDSPSVVQGVRRLLGRLRNNPRAPDAAWELASLLNSRGCYEESLEIFDYAVELYSATVTKVPTLLTTQRLSAMLDAGRAQQAVDIYSSLPEETRDSSDLQGLMVEALRSLGQEEKAKQLIQSMAARYKILEAKGITDRSVQAELAWFYLVTNPDPQRAGVHARRCASETDDPVIQRIVGASELATGEVDEGIARLKPLVTKDVYAAGILSEYCFSHGEGALAREAIERGCALTRGGPAFRKLLAVARANGVTIPPLKDAPEIRQILSEFERGYMRMGRHPEEFLSVEMRPLRDRIEPGERAEIEIVLMNKGELPVSLGEGGLVDAVMSLRVSVEGDAGASFGDAQLSVWAGPRYLRPGKKLTRKVSLDEDALVRFLFDRPLEEIRLNVTGMFDPVERGKELRSSIENVNPPPVTIVRRSLLGQFDRSRPENWAKAYELALGRIVRDMRRGDLETRLIAARKITSLLAHLESAKDGKVESPEQLASVMQKPVLLSLLRAVLDDSSPVVRSEALTGLQRVRLSPGVLMLLPQSIEDRDALVRFRTAELIGVSGSSGSRIVLEHLSRDGDELVKTMAELFLTGEDRVPPEAP